MQQDKPRLRGIQLLRSIRPAPALQFDRFAIDMLRRQ